MRKPYCTLFFSYPVWWDRKKKVSYLETHLLWIHTLAELGCLKQISRSSSLLIWLSRWGFAKAVNTVSYLSDIGPDHLYRYEMMSWALQKHPAMFHLDCPPFAIIFKQVSVLNSVPRDSGMVLCVLTFSRTDGEVLRMYMAVETPQSRFLISLYNPTMLVTKHGYPDRV